MSDVDKESWAYWYDAINTKERNDYQFYSSQLDKNDLALEIACGTGRIYLRMISNGYKAHGLDISENMLTKLRQNAKKQKIETRNLFHQNVSSMNLDYDYDLIYYPFNSIAHITGDIDSQLETFENIYTHLQTNGTFAFDIFVINFDTVSSYGEMKSKKFIKDDCEYKLETWSEIVSEVEQTIRSHNRIINLDKNTIEWETSHLLSLYPKQQLELLLRNVGFSDCKFYDEFSDEPINQDSEFMSVVAEK